MSRPIQIPISGFTQTVQPDLPPPPTSKITEEEAEKDLQMLAECRAAEQRKRDAETEAAADRMLKLLESGRTIPVIYRCRGCDKPLLPENYSIADGCPCNSPSGLNHGLVPQETCCCDKCFPAGQETVAGDIKLRYSRYKLGPDGPSTTPEPEGPSGSQAENSFLSGLDQYLQLLKRESVLLDRLEAAVQKLEQQNIRRQQAQAASKADEAMHSTPQQDAGEVWARGFKDRGHGSR